MVREGNRAAASRMIDAEWDLLRVMCDALSAVLDQQGTVMFPDRNGNMMSGWELARLLQMKKDDAFRARHSA